MCMLNVANDVFKSRRLYTISALALLVLLTSCVSVSPQRITTDRMDYGQVVADSWKRQTLLNVVRLRYADAPVFLEVASIINSYSVGGKASALATLPERTDPNIFQLGAEGVWSNTPTVTYQPLMGDRFTKSLLQPVPPTAVFQLMQGGWPADLVLHTVVSSINGLRNSTHGVDAEPRFYELTAALSRIQRSAGLGVRIESRKNGSAIMIVLRKDGKDTAFSKDARLVQELLGLEEGVDEFEITYALVPQNRREVAILSRSMLEIMLQLGFGVDLPAEHQKDGRALKGLKQEGDAAAKPLVRIHSGTQPPAVSYAAIPYKGYWYWIDDVDLSSKRAFTFLLILFSLAETGQTSTAPVVTVPSR